MFGRKKKWNFEKRKREVRLMIYKARATAETHVVELNYEDSYGFSEKYHNRPIFGANKQFVDFPACSFGDFTELLKDDQFPEELTFAGLKVRWFCFSTRVVGHQQVKIKGLEPI